jgi:hypothetical protein
LETLLSDLTTSLSSGDTSDALKSLVSFLVQGGQTTGGLVDTTA